MNSVVRSVRSRRGSSIIEVVVTIGISSVVLGITVAFLHMLLRIEEDTTRHMWHRSTFTALSAQFREDVGAATTANLPPDGGIDFERDSGVTIQYRREDDALIRIEKQGEETLRRESFRLPSASDTEFSTIDEGARIRLHVVHRWSGGLSDRDFVAEQTGRTIQFESRLGHQRRFLDEEPEGGADDS